MHRTRVNQNRNRLLNNRTYNFNHSSLVICLVVLQYCIDPRDCPCYLTHCFCLLNFVSFPCIFILKWTLPTHVGSSTFPTLEWFSILLSIFRLFSYHSNWLTRSLRWLLLLIPEIRRFETFLPLVKLLILLFLPCLISYGYQVLFYSDHSNTWPSL